MDVINLTTVLCHSFRLVPRLRGHTCNVGFFRVDGGLRVSLLWFFSRQLSDGANGVATGEFRHLHLVVVATRVKSG